MTAAEERFDALFRANYPDMLAYALRRCQTRSDAEDVVAETFAVAWRRIEDVPEGPRARLWLFGTARLVRMNSQRAHRRRESLYQRLRIRRPPERGTGADATLAERDRIERALAMLSPVQREVLQLHVWEELSAEEIATSLELTTSTVRKRLQRARERLAAALDDDPGGGSSAPLAFTVLSKEAAR